LISTVGTSNKALVVQKKDKSKNPNKKHPHPHHNKNQNKGPKPSQLAFAPSGDKGEKYKNKKIDRRCKFCGKDGHDRSKCFNNMETLEAAMKNHNISIDSTYSSSSHGHALFAYGFSFNATSTSSSNEWIIYCRASYHMAKDKAIFYTLNECNTNKIFVGDDKYLSVVGSGMLEILRGGGESVFPFFKN
jgi:hypothetical protein